MKSFNFWRENKTTNHFTINEIDLRKKFWSWIETKQKEWLEYYNSEMVIQSFISDKDGMNSVCENSEIENINKLLKPEYKTHLYGPKIENKPTYCSAWISKINNHVQCNTIPCCGFCRTGQSNENYKSLKGESLINTTGRHPLVNGKFEFKKLTN